MLFAVNKLNIVATIEVNFIESGNFFLPNDSDFSNISYAMKSESHINVPKDYVNLIELVRRRIHLPVNRWMENWRHLEN